jgi:putative Mg2+ transporter-C (MgtC) family protein
MNLLVEEFSLGMPDLREFARVCLRLFAASLFGALIGFQREFIGKPAGLRTHMLVALGSALFVVVPLQLGMDDDGASRIIQGVATGIGFIGGGAILKLSADREIEGLTTSAGIWLTSAIGIAVGLGGLGIGLIATILALVILTVVIRLEWLAKGARR